MQFHIKFLSLLISLSVGISPFVISVQRPQALQKRQDASTTKLIVAHHIVGNTFPHASQDWADDIALAHSSGIDGFALNLGPDDFQKARIADAYVHLILICLINEKNNWSTYL